MHSVSSELIYDDDNENLKYTATMSILITILGILIQSYTGICPTDARCPTDERVL